MQDDRKAKLVATAMLGFTIYFLCGFTALIFGDKILNIASKNDILIFNSLLPLLLIALAFPLFKIKNHFTFSLPPNLFKGTPFIVAMPTILVSCSIIIQYGIGTHFFNSPKDMAIPTDPQYMTLTYIICGTIIAPIAEELFYHGYLLSSMRDVVRTKKAILFVTVIFAIIHFPNPAAMITASIGGYACTVLIVRTGSLIPGILLHLVNNGVVNIIWLTKLGVLFNQQLFYNPYIYYFLIPLALLWMACFFALKKILRPVRNYEEKY